MDMHGGAVEKSDPHRLQHATAARGAAAPHRPERTVAHAPRPSIRAMPCVAVAHASTRSPPLD
jgi:hypothetical protein